ncbi:MAG TPA: tetratricopeptide repeat protein [Lacunisphaera sp.]|nr:tetratricopeptide repeat protein [Lacunisphaera sp.]
MSAAPAPLHAQALAHFKAGRLAEALPLIEQVLATGPVGPAAASFHLLHGLILRGVNRPDDALAAFRQAAAVDPKLAEAHHQAGNVLKSLGRYAEAVDALSTASSLAPNHAPTWLNFGVACLEAGDRAAAIAAFQRAITLEPTRPEAHNILGHALASAGQNAPARAAFEAALRLRPGYAAAHDNLGRLDKQEGNLRAAVAHYRAALASQPSPETHSNLLFALNFLPDAGPAEVFAEHRRWNELYAAKLAPAAPPPVPPTAGRRLRIGYLSPDFNHHSVAYFIEPVLAAHDRTRFEVFCYASVRQPDHVTERLRGLAEHWRDIARLNDDDAAALIRADQLDLLIDLAGHTARHRLLVLARRPAPVQVTWIGYPNTTGLDAIDYRLTDAISDPAGTTEQFHSEKLVRLSANFSCYRPDDQAPPVNTRPNISSGGLTFGCFNNFAKVTPDVLVLWARLLASLPGSKLILKSRGLGDPAVQARILAGFGVAGIAPGRLTFNSAELSVADHLSLYHGVDIALDTFPYNGTTTTCEALWMGVPVITLAGRVHAARVGASLLTHLGLPEWIAATPDEYLRIAREAALDAPRRAALRASLRERMRASPLCDATAFTRIVENALASLAAGKP